MKNYKEKIVKVQILFLNSEYKIKHYVVVKVLFLACMFRVYTRNEFIMESMLRYECASIFFFQQNLI